MEGQIPDHSPASVPKLPPELLQQLLPHVRMAPGCLPHSVCRAWRDAFATAPGAAAEWVLRDVAGYEARSDLDPHTEVDMEPPAERWEYHECHMLGRSSESRLRNQAEQEASCLTKAFDKAARCGNHDASLAMTQHLLSQYAPLCGGRWSQECDVGFSWSDERSGLDSWVRRTCLAAACEGGAQAGNTALCMWVLNQPWGVPCRDCEDALRNSNCYATFMKAVKHGQLQVMHALHQHFGATLPPWYPTALEVASDHKQAAAAQLIESWMENAGTQGASIALGAQDEGYGSQGVPASSASTGQTRNKHNCKYFDPQMAMEGAPGAHEEDEGTGFNPNKDEEGEDMEGVEQGVACRGDILRGVGEVARVLRRVDISVDSMTNPWLHMPGSPMHPWLDGSHPLFNGSGTDLEVCSSVSEDGVGGSSEDARGNLEPCWVACEGGSGCGALGGGVAAVAKGGGSGGGAGAVGGEGEGGVNGKPEERRVCDVELQQAAAAGDGDMCGQLMRQGGADPSCLAEPLMAAISRHDVGTVRNICGTRLVPPELVEGARLHYDKVMADMGGIHDVLFPITPN